MKSKSNDQLDVHKTSAFIKLAGKKNTNLVAMHAAMQSSSMLKSNKKKK